MTKLTYLFILFMISACGNPHLLNKLNPAEQSTNPLNKEKETILNSLQGNYSGCKPSTKYLGYYNKIDIRAIDDNYHYEFELSAFSNCLNPYYRMKHHYKIHNASYESLGNNIDIVLELKMVEFKLIFNHHYYISQNYCGFNDWMIGSERTLTGVSCLDLLSTYDSHHSQFLAQDESEFVKIKSTANSIFHPMSYDESGDSLSEIKSSDLKEVERI